MTLREPSLYSEYLGGGYHISYEEWLRSQGISPEKHLSEAGTWKEFGSGPEGKEWWPWFVKCHEEEIERKKKFEEEWKRRHPGPSKATKAKLAKEKATRKKLLAIAAKKEKLIKSISAAEMEAWKVLKGYLWIAVSPTGKVYRETLKTITIKSPKDYIAWNAALLAHRRIYGVGYSPIE